MRHQENYSTFAKEIIQPARLKADFCKPIDMAHNANDDGFIYPNYVKWDSKTESYIFGKAAYNNGSGFKRGTGKYARLNLQADADQGSNTLRLYTSAWFNGFKLVAECCIPVIHDPGMASKYALEEMENDMGDPDGIGIKVKSSQNMFHDALFYLMKCPDSVFQKVVDTMFPGGMFPTDQVYITTKSGSKECINFKTYDIGNEFKTFTLRISQ